MKYEIVGDTLPVVICHLNKGEKMISDSGAMAWMDPCMKMETNGGGAGKIIGRMFSGETLFRNSYTANEDGLIAFASSFPGKIVAIDVDPGKEVIIQKSAFLASEENVETSVFFNKKFSSGIFGGEGFILTKVSGHGTCFIGRTNRTGHKTRFIGIECRIFIGYFSCQLHGRLIDFTHILLYMIIGHRNCGGTKCIRLNDIGTGFQIFTVYILNHVRACETK